jgi:signal transduction histidine kinase
MQTIATLPLFVDATDDELAWLMANSHEQQLARGEYFFREGQPVTQFYVVIEGELQISRTVHGEPMVLGTTPRGIMGGETFLLSGTPAQTNAQAILPSRLMVFELAAFLGIFTHCPTVGIKILRVAAERMQGFAALLMQQEKMAALGKLSAGLAHELNNPAAAATRAASSLRSLLLAHQARTVRLQSLHLSADAQAQLIALLEAAPARMAQADPLSTLDRSEREDALADWLDAHAVANGWELAPTFVAAQLTVDDLAALMNLTAAGDASELLVWLCEALTAAGLLDEVEQSTRRIAELVGAIKSYTYMDRGVQQEVDLHHDLENTLRILKHRLGEIQIVREYDPDLPKLMGRGGELNQVWTNLLDNAADALDGQGVIRLVTRRENNFVMVEITDNGPGIPVALQERIFEPFFTTKAVGAGTGMGLDISYKIIRQHNGTIEVRSEPGQTRFIVRLPLHPPAAPDLSHTSQLDPGGSA